MFLSDRVFSEGHKSCEIVQAYCLLVHWAPIESNWGEDRRWGWLGQAMRIATEILLNKTLTESTFQFYRTVSVLPQNAYQTIVEDRAKSWTLLFIAEIAYVDSTEHRCLSTLTQLGVPQPLRLDRSTWSDSGPQPCRRWAFLPSPLASPLTDPHYFLRLPISRPTLRGWSPKLQPLRDGGVEPNLRESAGSLGWIEGGGCFFGRSWTTRSFQCFVES